jgi:hypothetical protein
MVRATASKAYTAAEAETDAVPMAGQASGKIG